MRDDVIQMLAAIETVLRHNMPPVRRFQLTSLVTLWRIMLKNGIVK